MKSDTRVLVYNLTKLSCGATPLSGPLDVLVWAMDEGGRLPRSVSVYVDGEFIELERMSRVPVDFNSPGDSLGSLEAGEALLLSPELPPKVALKIELQYEEKILHIDLPFGEKTLHIDLLFEGKTIYTETTSCALEGRSAGAFKKLEDHAQADVEDVFAGVDSPSFPPGLDSRFLYFVRLDLKLGVHRVRVVCRDNRRRKHWTHGFFVSVTLPKNVGEPFSSASLKHVWSNLSQKFSKRMRWGWERLFSRFVIWAFQQEFFLDRWVCFTLINPERLGHLAANTEIYFSEKKCGLHAFPETQIVLFLPRYRLVEDHGLVDGKCNVANGFLLKLWGRKHLVVRDGLISQKVVENLRQACPAAVYSHRPHGHRDIHGCLDRTPPSVELPEDLRRKGDRLLEDMGVPKEARIVLYHHRSSEFVKKTYQSVPSSLDESRYGYRNVSATTYDGAVLWLIEKGYYVVRVGVEADAWHLLRQGAVDFASQRRDEWMDLYLFSRCEFFCGTTSGIYALADLFRKPIVFTNFAPLGHVYSWSPRHLTIFKKLREIEGDRIVPASEQLNSDLGWMIHWEKIPKDRYVYQDNSADEILEAVEEMVLRLEDRWNEDPRDGELQRKFWSAIHVGEYHCHKNSRIGAKFLKSNADWLLS